MLEITPKPENQPYAIIFRVQNIQKKLSVYIENNLEFVVCVWFMSTSSSPISSFAISASSIWSFTTSAVDHLLPYYPFII